MLTLRYNEPVFILMLRGRVGCLRQWIMLYLVWCSFLICSCIAYCKIQSNKFCCVLTTSYTGCPGRNVSDFEIMFLKLKYTDLTKETYFRSWTVTEIMAREKCGFLAVPLTVPGSRDVLPVHCACPSFSLQSAQAHSRCDCTYKVLGTLRTTATLVRVFM